MRAPEISNTDDTKMTSLLVGNLSWWTSEQDIRDAIRDVCVDKVQIYTSASNGKSKGFCLVTFKDDTNGLSAAKSNLSNILIHARIPEILELTARNFKFFESRFGSQDLESSKMSNELECLGIGSIPKDRTRCVFNFARPKTFLPTQRWFSVVSF